MEEGRKKNKRIFRIFHQLVSLFSAFLNPTFFAHHKHHRVYHRRANEPSYVVRFSATDI